MLRFFPFFAVTAFSWTSFASSAFVIAQCPSNGKFVTAAALLSNKFDTTSPASNCDHPGLQCDSSDDWHKIPSGWMVQESLQNYSELRIFLPLTHLFLTKLLFDDSTWIDQFPFLEFSPNNRQFKPLGNKLKSLWGFSVEPHSQWLFKAKFQYIEIGIFIWQSTVSLDKLNLLAFGNLTKWKTWCVLSALFILFGTPCKHTPMSAVNKNLCLLCACQLHPSGK